MRAAPMAARRPPMQAGTGSAVSGRMRAAEMRAWCGFPRVCARPPDPSQVSGLPSVRALSSELRPLPRDGIQQHIEFMPMPIPVALRWGDTSHLLPDPNPERGTNPERFQ
jgi:hypothetical protein